MYIVKRLAVELTALGIISMAAIAALLLIARQNGEIQLDRIVAVCGLAGGAWGAFVAIRSRVQEIRTSQLVLKTTMDNPTWLVSNSDPTSSRVNFRIKIHHKQGNVISIDAVEILIPQVNGTCSSEYPDLVSDSSTAKKYLYEDLAGTKLQTTDSISVDMQLYLYYPILEWDQAKRVCLRVLSQGETLMHIDIDNDIRPLLNDILHYAENGGIVPRSTINILSID